MIKSKDLYPIIAAVILSVAVSIIGANYLFKVEKVKTPVEVVEPITADFSQPSETYFNSNALDPTVTITIGEGQQDPF